MHLTSRLSHSLHQDPCAAALLGAEHPLVRVVDQLRVLLRQSLVVTAVLAASVAVVVEGQEFALSFLLAASVVPAGLGCATITRAMTGANK